MRSLVGIIDALFPILQQPFPLPPGVQPDGEERLPEHLERIMADQVKVAAEVVEEPF